MDRWQRKVKKGKRGWVNVCEEGGVRKFGTIYRIHPEAWAEFRFLTVVFWKEKDLGKEKKKMGRKGWWLMIEPSHLSSDSTIGRARKCNELRSAHTWTHEHTHTDQQYSKLCNIHINCVPVKLIRFFGTISYKRKGQIEHTTTHSLTSSSHLSVSAVCIQSTTDVALQCQHESLSLSLCSLLPRSLAPVISSNGRLAAAHWY